MTLTRCSISVRRSRIKTAEEAIERARLQIDLKKPENYGKLVTNAHCLRILDPDRHWYLATGFASMAAVPYAHIVAKILEGRSQKGAVIALAPNPKDIVRQPQSPTSIQKRSSSSLFTLQIWKNVTRSDAGNFSGKLIGFLLLAVVCAFYTIPLSAVSFVANLSAVRPLFFPSLMPLAHAGTVLRFKVGSRSSGHGPPIRLRRSRSSVVCCPLLSLPCLVGCCPRSCVDCRSTKEL